MNQKHFALATVKNGGREGHFSAVLSTGQVDRHGDIIEQDGWELDNFKSNPVVLFGHRGDRPAVGSADDIRIGKSGLEADFHFNLETQLGQELNALYAARDMRAISVGFRAIETEFMFEEFENEEGEKVKRFRGIRFKRQELWEFSAVPIPANPGALVQMSATAARLDADDAESFGYAVRRYGDLFTAETKSTEPALLDQLEGKSEEDDALAIAIGATCAGIRSRRARQARS